MPEMKLSNITLGFANAGIILVFDGLFAAAGVHFWTDIVFPVLWGLV